MNTDLSGLILIVDDTPANLDAICETLVDAGFDVAISTSGERALQQVERELPDLILLDIMMPGMDGFETCKRLKANPRTAHLPIIFMTALSDAQSKVQAFELGGVDYVSKPFQEVEVIARVKTHLQLHRLTQSLEQKVLEKTAELEASQLQLIQNEKMSSLGNLVAGVAHEINNPVGFLKSSLSNAKDYTCDLLEHLQLYQKYYPVPPSEIEENAAEIHLEFMSEDFLKLLHSMSAAVERIIAISNSLRIFSRANSDRPVIANLHECLDSTLLILKYRLKANERRPEIEMIKDYGQIPDILCFPGQLNQVFMNILANAIDALDEASTGRNFAEIKANPNRITIRTRAENGKVKIAIADNGVGMSAEVKAKVFDRLFTTKKPGKGTGLGLAIARQIIEEKHGGILAVNSELGKGSEFVISLPVGW
ncbi:response regulator [Oscillatoria sp. FACHB-1406]|uniref:hybrid sensor histidine kinase/response regulator n=1 Tax=Oscillatoria sp. FACHB-1406 TaxID=2692846 RepID=UPI0016849706|nr:response regulator [Oscillatoria sp. FACHB-1406]MBD2578044.1 response regulator [Oscillatoria sp. FACHB-1406]